MNANMSSNSAQHNLSASLAKLSLGKRTRGDNNDNVNYLDVNYGGEATLSGRKKTRDDNDNDFRMQENDSARVVHDVRCKSSQMDFDKYMQVNHGKSNAENKSWALTIYNGNNLDMKNNNDGVDILGSKNNDKRGQSLHMLGKIWKNEPQKHIMEEQVCHWRPSTLIVHIEFRTNSATRERTIRAYIFSADGFPCLTNCICFNTR